MDSKLEQLHNFRDILAPHDRSLDQCLNRTSELGLQGTIPLRALFDNSRREYPELIPKLEVYGQIPVLKQQGAHALATIEGKIRTVERELTEYEQRNRLASRIHNARHLITERIEEGDTLRKNSALLHTGSERKQQWRAGTRQTRKNVFISPWDSQEFERITKAAENQCA